MKPHTDEPRAPHVHDPAELHNEDVAHEHTDVNIRAIVMFAVGLIVVAAVVHGLMYGMFWWLDEQARQNDPQRSPLATPAPAMPARTTESLNFGHARGGAQLLTNEPLALQKLREEENKRLHGYGWVEGKPGVAHMPIDEAKKLILERGVPVRAGEPLAPTAGTRSAAGGEASGGRSIPTGKKTGELSTAPAEQPPREQQQPAQKPAAEPVKHQ